MVSVLSTVLGNGWGMVTGPVGPVVPVVVVVVGSFAGFEQETKRNSIEIKRTAVALALAFILVIA
jgi:hypothetical protein